MNRVILLGRLTRDPELRYMPSGSPTCAFGLAMNHSYTKDGAKVDDTTFVDIDCYGKTAENVNQYLSKGRQALIEGRLKFRTWEGKDGGKRSKLSVTAERVTFIGYGDDKRDDGQSKREDTQADPRWVPDDEVPF